MDAKPLILGVRTAWDREEPVVLSDRDRRQHLLVLGKSGVGKTTLLLNLLKQDVDAGRGFAVIDPHGDLIRELLEYLPKSRIEDVVYFDPSDSEYPVAFNLLRRVAPERRHLVVSGIVGALKATWPEFFGPRMENVMGYALAALLECQNVSILGLQRMLTDECYREWVVRQVTDPVVRAFWTSEFAALDKKTKAEVVGPVLNKIGAFLLSPQLRNVLGQVWSKIDVRYFMDDSRIVLVNLSKGKIGPDKANLLGSLWVSQFQLAAMSRADVSENDRVPFALYVDEWQSFVSESFTSTLSECRKYGLSLVLANQYLEQLKPTIREAVLGNVGSMMAFRVGHEDALVLQKSFGDSIPARNFSGLANGEAYAKILSRGREPEPFLARTAPTPRESRGNAEAIIDRSRERFAARRERVEDRIASWYADRLGNAYYRGARSLHNRRRLGGRSRMG